MASRGQVPNDNPGSRPRDPAESKRRRIFEAAEPLFDRFGYRKTTIEDVCRAAGMSKRTFYELFTDKKGLLLQLVECVMNDATDQWESGLSPQLEPLDRLHSLIDWYAMTIREHPFFRVLVEDLELMRLFGEHLDEIRMTQMGGPFDSIVRDGIATGQFRNVDPRAAMWIVLGLLDTVYLLMPRVMDTPGALDDPVLSGEVRQFIVRGLGAVAAPEEGRPPQHTQTWQPPADEPSDERRTTD